MSAKIAIAKGCKIEKIIHENKDNGILCGIGIDPEKGECFIKEVNYGAFSTQKERDIVRNNAKTEAETLERLAKISKLAGKVPKLYESFDNKSEGKFVIIMQNMQGVSLRAWMNKRSAKNMDEKSFFARRRIILQICEIMCAIHNKFPSIVHRDLKPENIIINLVDGRWQVSVVDFGCAGLNFVRRVGTPGYCAPEQSEEYCQDLSTNYGAHTDIFAIGQIYYELLLGKKQLFGVQYLADTKTKTWIERPALTEKLIKMRDGSKIDGLLKKMTEFNPDTRKYRINYDTVIAILKSK